LIDLKCTRSALHTTTKAAQKHYISGKDERKQKQNRDINRLHSGFFVHLGFLYVACMCYDLSADCSYYVKEERNENIGTIKKTDTSLP